jgi:hypothetical protein
MKYNISEVSILLLVLLAINKVDTKHFSSLNFSNQGSFNKVSHSYERNLNIYENFVERSSKSKCKKINKGSLTKAKQLDTSGLELPPEQLNHDNYMKPEYVKGAAASGGLHEDSSINSPDLLSADPMNTIADLSNVNVNILKNIPQKKETKLDSLKMNKKKVEAKIQKENKVKVKKEKEKIVTIKKQKAEEIVNPIDKLIINEMKNKKIANNTIGASHKKANLNSTLASNAIKNLITPDKTLQKLNNKVKFTLTNASLSEKVNRNKTNSLALSKGAKIILPNNILPQETSTIIDPKTNELYTIQKTALPPLGMPTRQQKSIQNSDQLLIALRSIQESNTKKAALTGPAIPPSMKPKLPKGAAKNLIPPKIDLNARTKSKSILLFREVNKSSSEKTSSCFSD